jgi:MATE family multidrug resistance protein
MHGPASDFPVTHRSVLAIAVPMTLAHLTTPLLGVVDTAVIGQLGQAHLIAAVAVSAVLFDFIFWIFGSLRMGTIGLAAQALGRGDALEIRAVFLRALMLAGLIGVLLVALQRPIAAAGLAIMGASAEASAAAATYIGVRILAAPFTLTNYVVLGWLIGTGRTVTVLVLQVGINLTNMALTIWFVIGLDQGIAGAAAGTVVAEVAGALAGLAVCARLLGWRIGAPRALVLARDEVIRTLAVNRDIMIRSAALIAAFAFFTSQGARSGDVTVAANALLMNLFLVGGYFLDGFATAAEQMGGRAVGARRRDLFARAVSLTFLWGVVFGFGVAATLWFAGELVIDLMTTNAEVRAAARTYLLFAALTPLAGIAAFQFDGIYIGATWTVAMRNMMVLSLAIYFATWAATRDLGNTGLWIALLTFLAVRGITLGVIYPAMVRRTFG